MSEKNIIKKVVRSLRRDLNYSGLDEKNVTDNPYDMFEQWMKAAIDKKTLEPNAMTLATASLDGAPTARTVLLKDYSSEGFVFYTNFNSRKGRNLTENPNASLAFYWDVLSRQVLIDGSVKKMDRKTTVEYFHSRPRGSQIAAYVSHQSEAVQDRKQLEDLAEKAKKEFEGKEIPCPEHWGGFCLVPHRIEFWQGQSDRLHDRICYTQKEDRMWYYERLAP